MSDEWEFYECAVDEHRAIIAVDVGRFEEVPDEKLPFTLRVTVPLRSPRSDGLPDGAERPRLNVIEEQLTHIFGTVGAVHVGRASFDGAVRHYYYAPGEEGVELAARRCQAAITDREIEVGGYDDPDWQQYLEFLYPNPLGWQFIHDRNTCDALRAEGDDLERSRTIEHCALFPTADERAAFAAAVTALGYQVDGTSETPSAERGFVVEFSKPLAPLDIFPVTIELFCLAEEHGGDYDGWGCEVQTPASA